MEIKNILFARDFSDSSEKALPIALDFAERTRATLHMVYAEELHGADYDPSKEPSASKDEVRKHLTAYQTSDGLDVDPEALDIRHEVVRDVSAGPALLNYADEHDTDVIILGTHGHRGLRRMIMGSVAEEIVRRAPCPVLTVRAGDERPAVAPISSILVPTDFSNHARSALRHAKALADLFDARLTLLHVIEETLHPAFYGPTTQSVYDVRPDIDDRAIDQMQEVYRETFGTDDAVEYRARPGRAARRIAAVAKEEGASLIVMATHGRTGLEHFTMGSVAEKVVRRAPCPVFTVKSYGKQLVAGGPAAVGDG